MKNNSTEDLVFIGILGRPHGVRGQIRCRPQTHDLDRHELLQEVFIQKGDSLQKLHVESSSSGNGVWFLKFKDFDSPESVASLVNGELFISSEERLPPPEGLYYLSDFSGFSVFTEKGEQVGCVKECLELPSVNAFQIRFSKEKESLFSSKEILVPWIDDCILSIEESEKKIVCSESFLISLCPEKED